MNAISIETLTASPASQHSGSSPRSDVLADFRHPEADALISRARQALAAFQGWSEARVDALLRDVAETLADRAEELAAEAVRETGIGRRTDKAIKIRFATLGVLRSFEGQPAAGVIREDRERGVTEIASPVGVVLGLVPLTNPVATVAFKALIALKGRNAIIFSCHREGRQVGALTVDQIRAVLRAHGAPADLVQCVKNRRDRHTTQSLMSHPGLGLILATGGQDMVKAAYSSGRPAIGVGPGNAPAWIAADADLVRSAEIVVGSKSFDHGVICGSENHLVVDERICAAFCRELEREGAALLRPSEVERLSAALFEDGKVSSALLGQSAATIAQAAGIERGYPIRLLVAPLPLLAVAGPFGREKLAPVVSLFVAQSDEHAVSLCQRLLDNEGTGHTAIIHTQSEARLARFAAEVTASRILVNSSASLGCFGCGNGLTPSLSLASGTIGGTSTTDNVGYTHLLNIRRIARPTPARP